MSEISKAFGSMNFLWLWNSRPKEKSHCSWHIRAFRKKRIWSC